MNLSDRESADRRSASAAFCREHRHSCSRPSRIPARRRRIRRKTTSELSILISDWRRAEDATKSSGYFRLIVLSPMMNDIVGSLLIPARGTSCVYVPSGFPGFNPILFELISDVIDRKFFAFCPRCAPFEFIRRQNLNVREHAVRCNRFQRRLQMLRQFIISERAMPRRRKRARVTSAKFSCSFCSGALRSQQIHPAIAVDVSPLRIFSKVSSLSRPAIGF